MNIFKKFHEQKKLRQEKIHEAREGFVSWLEISKSKGWQVYENEVNRKIENISKQMKENGTLTGDDLKKLQLALFVWEDVRKLPKILEEKARSK